MITITDNNIINKYQDETFSIDTHPTYYTYLLKHDTTHQTQHTQHVRIFTFHLVKSTLGCWNIWGYTMWVLDVF